MSLDISVVVPTYNRPERIARCVAALADLEFDRERFEVVVVDDGSPTPIGPLIQHQIAALNGRCIRQENKGPAAARNLGLANAAGEWVAFTDDDCRPDRRWLVELLAATKRSPGAGIGGTVVNAIERNLCADTSQVLIEYLYDYFGTRDGGVGFFTSNNLAFPAETLRRIGGFDETFPGAAGEDRELGDRWRDHGYPLVFAPEAVVLHEHHLTLGKFWRQHWNYGKGAFHYHRARGRAGKGGHVQVLPLSFYGNLVLSGMRQLGLVRGIPATGLLVLSQAANALGFFAERHRQKIRNTGTAQTSA
jgi:GT2 family glycosyltransferase